MWPPPFVAAFFGCGGASRGLRVVVTTMFDDLLGYFTTLYVLRRIVCCLYCSGLFSFSYTLSLLFAFLLCLVILGILRAAVKILFGF